MPALFRLAAKLEQQVVRDVNEDPQRYDLGSLTGAFFKQLSHVLNRFVASCSVDGNLKRIADGGPVAISSNRLN